MMRMQINDPAEQTLRQVDPKWLEDPSHNHTRDRLMKLRPSNCLARAVPASLFLAGPLPHCLPLWMISKLLGCHVWDSANRSAVKRRQA